MPTAHGYSESKGILSARQAVVYRYEEEPGFPRIDDQARAEASSRPHRGLTTVRVSLRLTRDEEPEATPPEDRTERVQIRIVEVSNDEDGVD